MAGPVYKVNLFVNVGEWGFAETYYLKGPTSTATALAQARILAAARRPLLGADATLVAARVSDVGDGTSVRAEITNVTGVSFAGDIAGENNPEKVGGPWQAILGRMESSGGSQRRPFMLRGLPKSWYKWDSLDNAVMPDWDAGFNDAFQEWANVLTGINTISPWCIRYRQKSVGVNPLVAVSVVDTDNTYNQWKLTVKNADVGTILPGDRVQVRGAKGFGLQGLNGQAWVLSATAIGSTTDWILSTRGGCIGQRPVVVKRPTVQKVSYDYANITKVEYERYSSRDTGRAFFGTRGRQSKKVC